jgi:YidC/Oxa1 family membrane protein insertase
MNGRAARLMVGTMAVIGVLLLVIVGALPVGASSHSPELSPTVSAQPSASPGTSAEPSPGASPQASPAASPGQSQAPCPPATPAPDATPLAPGTTPAPLPLCPAQLSGNPVDLLAWLFNPIFQTLFLGLVAFYSLTGDIGIAIILLTLLIKTVLLPLSRRQIVSQRKMQMIQPELRAIQQKFKGNRTKISEETMRLYRERGVSLGAGCLPAFLQLGLLIPIYSVISQGLAAPDISSALQVLGQPVLNIACQAPGTLQPCLDPTVSWLGNLPAHRPETLFTLPVINFGISGLALFAALLQLIQTRMMTPRTTDPQAAAQQRIFLILPLFSIIYGAILPSGLFLYWIVFTAYSIVQQYLIAGWGSLFPLFGWTPRFAQNHQPRFPVALESKSSVDTTTDRRSAETKQAEVNRSPSDKAAGTFRQGRGRARTSRRGRRR